MCSMHVDKDRYWFCARDLVRGEGCERGRNLERGGIKIKMPSSGLPGGSRQKKQSISALVGIFFLFHHFHFFEYNNFLY